MARAMTVGVLVALCSSLLGVSLVLKRYSMIGDGLSHVGFGALAIAVSLGMTPLYVAIPVVIIAAFLLLRISENSKIKGDTAIAMISTGSLAIGVFAVSMSKGMNIDILNYMFGSILSMNQNDVLFSIILSIVVMATFVLFYNRIFAVTFDENFARATDTKAGGYNMLIALLTAVTVVIGMRMMGAMLISSLIIFPPLSAMRICKRFKTVAITSAAISVMCFIAGLVSSYLYSTPTGASVVIANIIVFAILSAVSFVKSKLHLADKMTDKKFSEIK